MHLYKSGGRTQILFTKSEAAFELGVSCHKLNELARLGTIPQAEREFANLDEVFHRGSNIRKLCPPHRKQAMDERWEKYKREAARRDTARDAAIFLAHTDFGSRAVAGEFTGLLPEVIATDEKIVGGGIVCGEDLYIQWSSLTLAGEMRVRQAPLPISKIGSKKLPASAGALVLLIAGSVPKQKSTTGKRGHK